MAEDDEKTEDAASGGGMMQKLLMGGGALVLVVVGVVAGPSVMNLISPPEEDAAVEEEAEPALSSKPPLYTSLHPPLIVNFNDSLGDQHFMQMTLEVMARDQDVINAVREHAPVIRNDLILLYTNVLYEDVTTREGKEKMLADGLAQVQAIMTEQIGEPGVEALYFSGLVIQ